MISLLICLLIIALFLKMIGATVWFLAKFIALAMVFWCFTVFVGFNFLFLILFIGLLFAINLF